MNEKSKNVFRARLFFCVCRFVCGMYYVLCTRQQLSTKNKEL